MIRIGLKSLSVRPCPDVCRHAIFHPNPCTSFWVILLTDRQTDRPTNEHGQTHIPPYLSEVMTPLSRASLLVFHCNCVFISYHVWDIQHRIMAWPWILGYGSFKVIENGTIRKLGYGFLSRSIATRPYLYMCRHSIRTWRTDTVR